MLKNLKKTTPVVCVFIRASKTTMEEIDRLHIPLVASPTEKSDNVQFECPKTGLARLKQVFSKTETKELCAARQQLPQWHVIRLPGGCNALVDKVEPRTERQSLRSATDLIDLVGGEKKLRKLLGIDKSKPTPLIKIVHEQSGDKPVLYYGGQTPFEEFKNQALRMAAINPCLRALVRRAGQFLRSVCIRPRSLENQVVYQAHYDLRFDAKTNKLMFKHNVEKAISIEGGEHYPFFEMNYTTPIEEEFTWRAFHKRFQKDYQKLHDQDREGGGFGQAVSKYKPVYDKWIAWIEAMAKKNGDPSDSRPKGADPLGRDPLAQASAA